MGGAVSKFHVGKVDIVKKIGVPSEHESIDETLMKPIHFAARQKERGSEGIMLMSELSKRRGTCPGVWLGWVR